MAWIPNLKFNIAYKKFESYYIAKIIALYSNRQIRKFINLYYYYYLSKCSCWLFIKP